MPKTRRGDENCRTVRTTSEAASVFSIAWGGSSLLDGLFEKNSGKDLYWRGGDIKKEERGNKGKKERSYQFTNQGLTWGKVKARYRPLGEESPVMTCLAVRHDSKGGVIREHLTGACALKGYQLI